MEKVQSMINTRMLYLLSWIQSLILFLNAQSKLLLILQHLSYL